MGDAAKNKSLPVVVVTGFGPFGHHKVNASWEAVKALRDVDTENDLKIKLVTHNLPVEYDYVETEVPKLWKEHNPELVIHVGVSNVASSITLETQAYKSGYKQTDNCGRLPVSGCNCLCETECLQSTLDVPSISTTVTEKDGVPVCISKDAGRYLCEFSYFSSLSQDKSKAIFIHVPELNKPYTANELAKGIKGVIREMLNQRKRLKN
ncbi:pyroglutamyl-peptidase 1-like [Neocloeon triangulifer]|uniref:pyroglutamyl-peptidase 1-like n=1 Tax=Neocloeon triangulifer TaxID=2078957 RepID=UPI00286F0E1C|nr:pyroglutamyl-peptidase 1-like [Neocloeon triangulifer]XP_059474318.1 pyroglutamyl-peptidase 1-like [Neocloeon triangulifer]XP_059474319.1 pyroglutamyl-peptidase 1-like [Neocloeon triangulifer]